MNILAVHKPEDEKEVAEATSFFCDEAEHSTGNALDHRMASSSRTGS